MQLSSVVFYSFLKINLSIDLFRRSSRIFLTGMEYNRTSIIIFLIALMMNNDSVITLAILAITVIITI